MADLLALDDGKVHGDFPGIPGRSAARPAWHRCRPVAAAACKTAAMRISVLAGGVGGARFLRGLRAAAPDAEITVIGNTGDDITLFGLHVSPDLDTVMYTLGGGISEEQGWGRDQETFTVLHELAAYGLEPDWFSLGDRDFATHIARTAMLTAGLPLSTATRALCERWQPGVTLLPMSDDTIETQVADRRWIRSADRALPGVVGAAARGGPGPPSITAAGARDAGPAPGVLDAIEAADFILLPPSNPVVSIGIILAVPGDRQAVRAKTVVGVSPIIGGAPVRGMADACLTAIGVPTTAAAVGRALRRRACSTAGWSTSKDRPTRSRPRARRDRGPGDAAVHDRSAGVRGHRPRGG